MFSHLVESDLHTGEFKRKGTFFLLTLAAYALLFMVAGVVGVYAYQARIEDQNLELVALVPPETEEPRPREPQTIRRTNTPNPPANATAPRSFGGPARTAPSNTSPDPTRIAGAAQGSTTQIPPEIRSAGNGPIGLDNGPYNPNGDPNSSSNSSTVGTRGGGIIDEPPPAIVKRPPETKRNTIVSLGVVNSRALNLPEPVYPPIARASRVQGIVTVEILIDETGRVAQAHATTGNPLLKPEAERAALRARFSPTLLSQQPVKAKGIITFNFILR